MRNLERTPSIPDQARSRSGLCGRKPTHGRRLRMALSHMRLKYGIKSVRKRRFCCFGISQPGQQRSPTGRANSGNVPVTLRSEVTDILEGWRGVRHLGITSVWRMHHEVGKQNGSLWWRHSPSGRRRKSVVQGRTSGYSRPGTRAQFAARGSKSTRGQNHGRRWEPKPFLTD